MKPKFFRFAVLAALIVLTVTCAQRKNASGRIGRGSASRSSSAYAGATKTTAATTAQATGNLAAFFSNYQYSNGLPYILPCGVNQIRMSANVATSADSYGRSEIPSSGGQLHLSFELGCVVDNGTNEIQVDIADGMDGYKGASGWIENGMANIAFTDDYGTIRLAGYVSGGQFSGQIMYENDYLVLSNGGISTPGASGSIGSFSIPVCSVFNCSSF